MVKEKQYECIECGKPAEVLRATQFAGDHPFCEECAKKENDWDSDTVLWFII